MVKIFIGNLPRQATEQELRNLFEKYGKVVECDIIKNYGFVHMDDKLSAEEAIRSLHQHVLHGVAINVEASRSKAKTSTKLHVGNISSSCTNQELRAKFEEYGPVLECDIVKDYAFVHLERAEDAIEAIKGLDNTEFKGKRMHVQLSTSRLRTAPGMGDKSGCFRCGKEGHWSKECPVDRPTLNSAYSSSYDPYPPVRPAYPSGYGERSYFDERDRFGVVDYYERYRVRPYGSAYDLYTERRLPIAISQSALRDRLSVSTSLDPYERRLLPPPSTYYDRDRSPLRRQSTLTTSSGTGYILERTRLSPVPSVSRSSFYELARSYLDRTRYAY
ncbi:RNA-binding protein 4B-like isoform X1 [Protopterus annectens]|uniref:RNA-binding protein 4B-like isoform X1 n=1 Tax=Protopterus annectens TaxID=7888 RepID=UPI001CFA9E8A|nr:RNA-binding protein 4B-like isoform X1 [Protopterus annectens]